MGICQLLRSRSCKSLELFALFVWAAAARADLFNESLDRPASVDAAVVNLTTNLHARRIQDMGSRPFRSDSSDMFRYHKELFPLSVQDIICLVIAATCMMVAAGGGIGGGGILVPLYMIFLQFRPKHAVALSNFTILGGALANTMINAPRTDSAGRSLIDWDIIVMMEPSTIGGTVVGSFASKYLSDFVLMVSLASVLSVLAFRTLDKGWAMFLREAEGPEDRHDEASEEDTDRAEESRNLMGGAGAIRTSGSGRTPWRKVLLLMFCFLGSSVLTILKGSGRGSVVGVECGSGSFWILSWATIPWVLGFGMIFRRMLTREYLMKEQDGHQFQTNDIRWDATNTIKYPIICSLAGIFAGLFGVGGGIVKGPLMLEMGVNPQVAAATAATMILFTSSAASVSFEVFGLLEPSYGPACFMLGFSCTLVGHYIIQIWMKAARRQSPPVLSIGIIMAVSTFLVLLEIFDRLTNNGFEELMVPASLCNDSD